jgi:hypothetical protein
MVIIALGLVVFLQNGERLEGCAGNLFSFHNALLMIVTTFAIKSVHELGHGLTCKHFGGEVHEVGAMMLVFQPYFFVNVSDSWNDAQPYAPDLGELCGDLRGTDLRGVRDLLLGHGAARRPARLSL